MKYASGWNYVGTLSLVDGLGKITDIMFGNVIVIQYANRKILYLGEKVKASIITSENWAGENWRSSQSDRAVFIWEERI